MMEKAIILTVAAVLFSEIVIYLFYILLKRLSRTGDSKIVFPDGGIKCIEIGEWDMQSNESLTLDHGLCFEKIENIQVLIKDDSGAMIYPLGYISDDMISGYFTVTDAKIIFVRHPNGFFNSSSFNDNSVNRGDAIIHYRK